MRDTKRRGLRYIAVACLFAALTMLWAPAAFSITTRPARDVMNQRLSRERGAVASGAKVTNHLAGANETRSVVANATGDDRFSQLTPVDLHSDRGSHRLEIHNRRIVITGC